MQISVPLVEKSQFHGQCGSEGWNAGLAKVALGLKRMCQERTEKRRCKAEQQTISTRFFSKTKISR